MPESLTPLVNAAQEVVLLVATVSIAIFTGLTWVVYGKLRNLTATIEPYPAHRASLFGGMAFQVPQGH